MYSWEVTVLSLTCEKSFLTKPKQASFLPWLLQPSKPLCYSLDNLGGRKEEDPPGRVDHGGFLYTLKEASANGSNVPRVLFPCGSGCCPGDVDSWQYGTEPGQRTAKTVLLWRIWPVLCLGQVSYSSTSRPVMFDPRGMCTLFVVQHAVQNRWSSVLKWRPDDLLIENV